MFKFETRSFRRAKSASEFLEKSIASVFVSTPCFEEISEASASSLEAVRETRRTLNLRAASWRAYSLPIPSDAPVMTAQLPLGP